MNDDNKKTIIKIIFFVVGAVGTMLQVALTALGKIYFVWIYEDIRYVFFPALMVVGLVLLIIELCKKDF